MRLAFAFVALLSAVSVAGASSQSPRGPLWPSKTETCELARRRLSGPRPGGTPYSPGIALEQQPPLERAW
jgi:hypothetical protein